MTRPLRARRTSWPPLSEERQRVVDQLCDAVRMAPRIRDYSPGGAVAGWVDPVFDGPPPPPPKPKHRRQTCSAEGCNRPNAAKGLCGIHYNREKRAAR